MLKIVKLLLIYKDIVNHEIAFRQFVIIGQKLVITFLNLLYIEDYLKQT